MSKLTEVVEGWTGALPFTLNADGDPVDLTGLTVQLWMKDCDETQIHNSSANVTTTGSTGGEVIFSPSSSQFVAAKTPYKLRFKVTDSTGRYVYFPNEEEDTIEVNVV